MKPADELAKLAEEIAEHGAQIERRRERAATLLVGMYALDRRGNRYAIDRVSVYQGGSGYYLKASGPRLTTRGNLHSRTRDDVPLSLLAKISRTP